MRCLGKDPVLESYTFQPFVVIIRYIYGQLRIGKILWVNRKGGPTRHFRFSLWLNLCPFVLASEWRGVPLRRPQRTSSQRVIMGKNAKLVERIFWSQSAKKQHRLHTKTLWDTPFLSAYHTLASESWTSSITNTTFDLGLLSHIHSSTKSSRSATMYESLCQLNMVPRSKDLTELRRKRRVSN